MKKTVLEWVDYGVCNVCAVDWSAMAGKSILDYVEVATKNTKQVANAIVRFTKFLVKEQGLNIEEVSIVGHR